MSKHRTITLFPKLAQQCTECGCNCSQCCSNSLDLHSEIEELKSRVSGQKARVSQLENELVENKSKAEQETAKLQDELFKLRERYDRLLDSQKKLQKLNNNLEDKLLTVVESLQKEKDELFENVSILTSKLSDASSLIEDLEDRCLRLQSDCNIAVQLLQCKPSEFVAHRLNALPLDLQNRVKSLLTKDELTELETINDDSEDSYSVRLPMSTFPPTAVCSAASNQSMRKQGSENDAGRQGQTVPMTVIAKALQQSNWPKLARSSQAYNMCQKCGSTDKYIDSQITEVCSDVGRSCLIHDELYSNSGPPGVHKASSCKFVLDSR